MPRGRRWQKRVEKRASLQESARVNAESSEKEVEPIKLDEPVKVQEKPEKKVEEEEEEVELPEGLEEEGAGWYTASDGEKIRGEKKAIEYQNKLNSEGDSSWS